MKYKIEFDICRESDNASQDLLDILSNDEGAFGNSNLFIGIMWNVEEVPNHENDNVWAVTAETNNKLKKDNLLAALAYEGFEDGVLLNSKLVDMSEYVDELA